VAVESGLGMKIALASRFAQSGGCAFPWRERSLEAVVLISTMNDLPGFEITEVLGEVFGLTVRSRNVGSQIGASFKALAGGELKGMTKNLVTSRQEVTERMVQEAQAKGADAVLAMRFDTSEMGPNWTEICAYGTAVKCRKL
jgi:uncharacterized protein YbjQ (UPF0145 family)